MRHTLFLSILLSSLTYHSFGQGTHTSEPREVAPGYYLDFGLTTKGTWLLKRNYLFYLDPEDHLVNTFKVNKDWETIEVVPPDRTFLLSPDSAVEFSLEPSVIPGTGEIQFKPSIERRVFFREIEPKVAVTATSTIHRVPILFIFQVPSLVPTPPVILPYWDKHGVEYALHIQDEGFYSLGRFVDTVAALRPKLRDPSRSVIYNREPPPYWDTEGRMLSHPWGSGGSAMDQMVTPLDVPAFMSDGQFYIFDHLNDQILIYDPVSNKEDYFDFNFHKRLTDPYILKDISLGQFYQVMEKNGAYYLIPLLGDKEHPPSIGIGLFPYRIGIRDGFVYLIDENKKFVKKELPALDIQ